MALSNTHIEKPLGKTPGKTREPRSRAHGGSDGDDFFILLSKLCEGLAKLLGEVGFFLLIHALLGIKGSHTVVGLRLLLSQGIAPAFLGDYMNQNRGFELLGPADDGF